MAWGTLKEVGWVNAFTSGKYATDNYVKYQIDESSRKLRVIVTRQRVRSLDSYHSYDGPTNNGCQFVNGDKDSSYPKGYDTNDSIKVSGNGTVNIPSNKDREIGAVYTYNDDGSVPSISLSTQMIFTLSGYDPTSYNFSVQNWKSQELKSKFPTIAKKAPNPVKDIIVTGVTTSTISISFTASSNASSYLVDWGTVNSTDETEGDMLAQGNATITDTTYTITNLDKNQLYLIMVTSLGSDGTGDNREIGYGKTLNVDPVTNVSVTKVSANSITVNFNLSQYAIKYSIVAIAIDDSGTASQAYSTTSTGTPATITGLSPNTKYKVGVSAIGTNNDMSDYVYVNNVTTLSQEQSPVMVNVDGIAKQVINAYINVNGVAKDTVAIYVNVNGTAKKCI